MRGDRLGALAAAGVSVWLDGLSREHLNNGRLRRLVEDKHVVGVTTNPTTFATAVALSEVYTSQVRELARRRVTVADAVRSLMVADVQRACDLLRRAWQATGGVDGRVSLEVNPGLAADREATITEAVSLMRGVGRPNLYIKIPATRAGLPAITEAVALGIDVNVTLIFSVERYREVMHAYLDGLERALAAGVLPLSEVASVASFFVSRVDTEVDKRLEKIGTDQALALRGTAGIANSRLVYRAFRDTFTGPRWERLVSSGARVQRPLWASTSVKNPAYPDTRYVTELVAPGTVNTMAETTLNAFADHGELNGGDTVTGRAEEAQAALDAIKATGIDLEDVHAVLEGDGIDRFTRSWAELHATVGRLMGTTG